MLSTPNIPTISNPSPEMVTKRFNNLACAIARSSPANDVSTPSHSTINNFFSLFYNNNKCKQPVSLGRVAANYRPGFGTPAPTMDNSLHRQQSRIFHPCNFPSDTHHCAEPSGVYPYTFLFAKSKLSSTNLQDRSKSPKVCMSPSSKKLGVISSFSKSLILYSMDLASLSLSN